MSVKLLGGGDTAVNILGISRKMSQIVRTPQMILAAPEHAEQIDIVIEADYLLREDDIRLLNLELMM